MMIKKEMYTVYLITGVSELRWMIKKEMYMYCLLNNWGIRTQTDDKERNVCTVY